MEEYDAQMQRTLQELSRKGITHSIFGDIFLEDLRLYRETQLQRVNLIGEFPLWQRNTTELVHEFVDLGFKAVLVCVNEKHLNADFLGRELDLDLLKDLPRTVDPCGENGEYHSFVYDGPIFSSPVSFTKGESVRRIYTTSGGTDSHADQPDTRWDTGFWYQDLILQ